MSPSTHVNKVTGSINVTSHEHQHQPTPTPTTTARPSSMPTAQYRQTINSSMPPPPPLTPECHQADAYHRLNKCHHSDNTRRRRSMCASAPAWSNKGHRTQHRSPRRHCRRTPSAFNTDAQYRAISRRTSPRHGRRRHVVTVEWISTPFHVLPVSVFPRPLLQCFAARK